MRNRTLRPGEARQIWLILSAMVLALTFAQLISGCAGFAPFTAPQTFEERWAYGMATRSAVVDAAATSLAAGDISSATAEEIQQIAGRARTILQLAKAAADIGDLKQADAQLELATALIRELQAYLRRVET